MPTSAPALLLSANPRLDHFLQTDPVGYEDDLNRYAYVRNDPLGMVDPNGTDALTVGPELELVFGTGFSVGYGVAVSFPTPLDPTADFEIGAWGYISGRVGYGSGFSLFGGSGGSVHDLGGSTADITIGRGPIAISTQATLAEIRERFGATPPELSAGDAPTRGRMSTEIPGPVADTGIRSRAGSHWTATGGIRQGGTAQISLGSLFESARNAAARMGRTFLGGETATDDIE